MTHPALVVTKSENGHDIYADLIVKTAKPSQHNDRQITLIGEDNEFLQGPSGNAFWTFFADNMPGRGDWIKVALSSKPNTGKGYYQDVVRWRAANGAETPAESTQPKSGGFTRDDATGRSIERQVAFKGVVELATGYADTVEAEGLRTTALMMAEVLWGESLPYSGAPVFSDDDEPVYQEDE